MTGIAEPCCRATRRAGTTVPIGEPGETALAGSPCRIARDGNRLIGSGYGATRPLADFPEVLRPAKHAPMNLHDLVTGVRPFARINDSNARIGTGTVRRRVPRFDRHRV